MDRRGFLTATTLGLANLALAGTPLGFERQHRLTDSVAARKTTVRVPGFLPSTRGLHFGNDFLHVPDLQIKLPGGLTIPIGDAASGLCGGMVYTVRDLFEAGISPPRTTSAPDDGPVLRYLASRLLESLSQPFGPATYLELMKPALPDGDLPFVRGRAWRMLREEWPAIRDNLDRGTLSPLGLVTTKSSNPLDLGRNHQVLAWGYDLDGTQLTLRLYDPNHPDDDDVTLSLDVGHPGRATPVRCSHRRRPVWCFFRTSYQFKDPRRALATRLSEVARGPRPTAAATADA